MAYIVVLNPIILGTAPDSDGEQARRFAALAAATALVAGVMTILMGVVGRFPLALAAGLGLNALVAFEIAPQMTWADAMGLVVLEGLLITVLVLTGFRTAVFHAVPPQLKTAIGVGIGLFLDAHRPGRRRLRPPGPGRGEHHGPGRARHRRQARRLADAGLRGRPAADASCWSSAGCKGAILIGILGHHRAGDHRRGDRATSARRSSTASANPHGWALNVPKLPDKVVDVPDLSLLGHFYLFGSCEPDRLARRRCCSSSR